MNKDAICLQAYQEKKYLERPTVPWYFEYFTCLTSFLVQHHLPHLASINVRKCTKRIISIWSTGNKWEGIKSRAINLLWWTNYTTNISKTFEHTFSTKGKIWEIWPVCKPRIFMGVGCAKSAETDEMLP